MGYKLRKKIISGIKWTSISTLTSAILQLLQITVLARILEPADFGLVTIIMVIVGLSQVFADFGLNMAIIHKQDILAEQLSTLYWLNILFGLVLFILLVILSPLIANFYNIPSLSHLIPIAAIAIVIQSTSKQFLALFEKKMQFNTIAKIDIFSMFVNFLLSVLLAIKGFGVFSLIIPFLVFHLLKSFLLILKGLQFHKPKLVFDVKSVKYFIRFGVFQTGAGIVNYFNSQVDVLIIGRLLGSETLGIYSLAKQLTQRPAQIINPIVTRVTFPIMARVQDDLKELKKIYLSTLKYISLINAIAYSCVIVFSETLVNIFLGEKWAEATDLVRILAIYFAIRAIGNPIGSLIMARGKTEYEFYWNIGLLFSFPLFVYVGCYKGIYGVAYALVISVVLMIFFMWYFLMRKLCGVTLKELLSSIKISIIIIFLLAIYTYFAS